MMKWDIYYWWCLERARIPSDKHFKQALVAKGENCVNENHGVASWHGKGKPRLQDK